MCKNAKVLLAVSTLFAFAMGLSSIFINVFFWEETNSFIIIAIYNLMQYITTPIAFILAGMLAKKKNGVWSLRIGLLMYILFYALILFNGNKGTLYIYFLGIVFGIAVGFYWLAFNTLSFDFTHVNNRDTFNGFNGSCSGIAAAIAPITSAYIISKFAGFKGYKVVFAMTLIIFIILILISIILKCNNYSSRLDYKKIFSSSYKEWNIIRKSTTFWGFRDVIIVFLVNILIIQTTKNEILLGKFALIASLISSVSYILVQKVIKPSRRELSISIGTIGSFVATWGLIINISYSTLLIYVIMDAFFLPFFLIQLSSSSFNVIDKVHEGDMRVEYMINRDIALNRGRIISSIILIVLLIVLKNSSTLKSYLIFIGCAPIVSGYFLRNLSGLSEDKGFLNKQ
jgi:YQGE family putative transporter